MKKATVADTEMGNLLFGNSRGTYLIEPREEFQDIFVEFLDNNGFDTYGYHENDHIPFETDVFSIRPYYWGDDEEIAAFRIQTERHRNLMVQVPYERRLLFTRYLPSGI